MTDNRSISEEQLNALLDGELTVDEREEILRALEQDKTAAEELAALAHINACVRSAYEDIPKPVSIPTISVAPSRNPVWRSLAAGILLAVGIVAGWKIHPYFIRQTTPINDLTQLDRKAVENRRVLLHISTMDPKQIESVLASAESFLRGTKDAKGALEVEILVHKNGLGLLREGSPYAKRIQALWKEHDNVSFRACGMTMQAYSLIERHQIELLPEAEAVDGALDEILRRIKQGWLYVRV